MYGYIIVVSTICGLIGGCIGGAWGYRYESDKQRRRDKKDLDDAEQSLLIARQAVSSADDDELDTYIN